jgi:hypothetical protein
MGQFSKLFLNQGTEDKQVVEAPAFSLTKVMAVVAPLVTAVVTSVTAALKNISFSGGQITTLIVALIAFLAITASADVLARGLATSAQTTAAGRARWVRFDKPLDAKLELHGPDEAVAVLAASDASPPEYLCVRADKSLSWEPASKIIFG